jgi:predicted nucleic acid-binding Zn ribbon protein
MWTQEEVSTLRKLLSEGKRYAEIHCILDKTAKAVKCKAFKLGLRTIYPEKPNKLCPSCGKIITTAGNTYCDSSCSAKHNNPKRKKIYNCVHCGKEIGRHSKYCSNTCHQQHIDDLYIEKWKNGEVDGLQPTTLCIRTCVRKYIFDKYQHKCHKCGWNEVNPVSQKSTLQIEHIDGNYLNCSEINLDLLCPNCHSLTPTFGYLNRGNGRHKRRERYRNGQST